MSSGRGGEARTKRKEFAHKRAWLDSDHGFVVELVQEARLSSK